MDVHMTILFSRANKYPDAILQDIEKMATDRGNVSFNLKPWGKRSELVEGELLDFFNDVKAKYPELASDRKCHVEIRSEVENEVRYNTTYQTEIIFRSLGRSCVIDLSQCQPPIPTNNKNYLHVSILFSRNQQPFPYSVLSEIKRMASARHGKISFSLKKWGKKSDLVEGELLDFFNEVKEKFPEWSTDRKCYVEVNDGGNYKWNVRYCRNGNRRYTGTCVSGCSSNCMCPMVPSEELKYQV